MRGGKKKLNPGGASEDRKGSEIAKKQTGAVCMQGSERKGKKLAEGGGSRV